MTAIDHDGNLRPGVTDRLIFVRQNGDKHIMGWIAPPWPPPVELWLVTGAETGGTAHCDPTEVDLIVVAELVEHGATVEAFRRDTASKIPDPAPADAHWFRGAEYVSTGSPDLGASL